MHRVAIVALTFMAIAGCRESEIDKARSEVKKSLIDPDSATFRSEKVVPHSGYEGAFWVCGQVNSKNRLGGYVGYKDYAYQWLGKGFSTSWLEGERDFPRKACPI